MIRPWIIAVCLGSSLPLGLAAAPPSKTISWMQADLPPQFILDGELAGQGWADGQMHELFSLLPGFDHRLVQSSLSRTWYEIAHRDGVCFDGAARTPERENFALFSRRPIMAPSYRVIIRAADMVRFHPFLDEKGAVDLDRMAEEDGLAGGYTAARANSPAITRFIDGEQRRVRLETAVSPSQLFNLLHGKRLDFIISSPVEIPYYKARFHLTAEFASLPVKGGTPSIRGYVACSKGPLGRAVIEKIDALMTDESRWTAYIEPLRRWFEPADFAAALAARPHGDAAQP
ncbi:MAG TPA: TIGR02285 family protein [Magnetospirillaceae bacterium]|nr:TIGR02285 family protein [Magnetospirillaceae bacterium]